MGRTQSTPDYDSTTTVIPAKAENVNLIVSRRVYEIVVGNQQVNCTGNARKDSRPIKTNCALG
jgi:hypothetical protein